MLKINSHLVKSLTISYVVASLVACSGNQTPTESIAPAADSTSTASADSSQNKVVEEVLASLPSPMVVVSGLKESGAKFSAKSMNDPASAGKYSNAFSQALNTGVYGVDLLNTVFYGQTQSSIVYMEAQHKLMDGLGLSGVMDQDHVYMRFQANLGSRDSMLAIINNMISASNAHFQANQKYQVASLVIAGSWIEGLYLAMNQPNIEKSDVLMNLVANQTESSKKLPVLLSSFKSDPNVQSLLTDLQGIEAAFAQIKKDEAAQKMMISSDNLKEISQKVNSLRAKIIQATS